MGMTGSILVCSGMVGGFTGTLLITFKQNLRQYFDLMIKILTFIGLISIILFCSLLHIADPYVILIFVIGSGFGLLGMLPFACESLQEQVFPVDENVTMKFFYILANAFNILVIKLATLDAFGDYASFSMLVFLIPPAIYNLFFLKTDFNRRKYEQNQNGSQSVNE
eukprot:TRINITY_DN13258_c0_g1_i2.p1 TRINITY_DN13258_c0_g1~~TRINITY_DN13258_c0_g1_i2.p1  ORF type:complete len:166 (-),score=17.71 TRINITY_DN13258_c0_g1_i2:102-599(-)